MCVCWSVSIISCRISVLHHGNTSWNVLFLCGILISTLVCYHDWERGRQTVHSLESLCIRASTQWLKVKINVKHTANTCAPCRPTNVIFHICIYFSFTIFLIIINLIFIVMFNHAYAITLHAHVSYCQLMFCRFCLHWYGSCYFFIIYFCLILIYVLKPMS